MAYNGSPTSSTPTAVSTVAVAARGRTHVSAAASLTASKLKFHLLANQIQNCAENSAPQIEPMAHFCSSGIFPLIKQETM